MIRLCCLKCVNSTIVKSLRTALILAVLSCIQVSQAQDVPLDIHFSQSLNFGSLAILDNHSVQFIKFDYLGNISYSKGLRVIERGHIAIAEIISPRKNALLYITTDIIQPITEANGATDNHFRLTDIYTKPYVHVAANGPTILPIGGRLETSGNGSSNYADVDYNSRFSITVNF